MTGPAPDGALRSVDSVQLPVPDLDAGRSVTAADGTVTGVASAPAEPADPVPAVAADPSAPAGVRFRAAVPGLPVSDERRAAAFLERALGLAELQHDGRGLEIFVRDDVELHVWLADGSAPGAERHLAGSASCRIEVVGVRALSERCRELGVVHPQAPLRDQWWGTREFGALDPDGNLITLDERV